MKHTESILYMFRIAADTRDDIYNLNKTMSCAFWAGMSLPCGPQREAVLDKITALQDKAITLGEEYTAACAELNALLEIQNKEDY